MNAGPSRKKKVLVAPLDWGLGHATRCIPVINALLTNGCEVVLASAGPQAALLSEAFPGLPILDLPGYGIGYSRRMVWWKILWQVPKIRAAIAAEHQWLQQLMQRQQFDAIISDNRYGLWTDQCTCVIITHQLQPAMPSGMGWMQSLARKVFYKAIERFTACWVPDEFSPDRGLSGLLGHPPKLPAIRVKYIGWLTRFSMPALQVQPLYKACIMLSGPEPQRSMLEEKVVAQMAEVDGPVLLVRGLPGRQSGLDVPFPHKSVNHLGTADLQEVMLQAEFLVCRSGYSTLMDAFTLQKKCIVVPTPGQTEQEYLAGLLEARQAVLQYEQATFNLKNAINAAQDFDFQLPVPTSNRLHVFVADWLQSI